MANQANIVANGIAQPRYLVDGNGNPISSTNPLASNIAQWNGAVPSATNPVIDQDQIRAFILNGQGFSASTGKQTSGGATQVGAAIFNNSTAKNIFVYSIRVGVASSSIHQLNLVTTDPAISGVAMTAANSKAGSSTASVAMVEAQNTAVTTTGTLFDMQYLLANTSVDFMANGSGILLPSGAANGVLALIATSTNQWICSLKWIEY